MLRLDPIQVFYLSRQLPYLSSTFWFWPTFVGCSSDNNLVFSALAVLFRSALFFGTSRVPAQSMLVSPAGGKTLSCTTHVTELPSTGEDRGTSRVWFALCHQTEGWEMPGQGLFMPVGRGPGDSRLPCYYRLPGLHATARGAECALGLPNRSLLFFPFISLW